MKWILLLFTLLTATIQLFAQSVLGKLFAEQTDGSRDILPGGTITWVGTQVSTAVNEYGSFELPRPEAISDFRIVASYTGYFTDTVVWNQDSYLSIVLRQNPSAIAEITVSWHRGSFISGNAVGKTEVISRHDLGKAACCDLAGCFGTQASVQSHTANAVTNAQELRLLGISGVYNQILFDGLPMIQGLSYTYGVSTYPGSIVENIHVAKGTTSVLQGFESISGQINVESRKPSSSEKVYLNAYTNSFLEKHLNANLSFDLGKQKNWQSLVALHTVQPADRVDGNQDGFLDLPLLTRYMAYNKWEYNTGREKGLTAQMGWRLVNEQRIGGQTQYRSGTDRGSSSIYGQSVDFTQTELFLKSGYRLDGNSAITLTASGFYHDQRSWFGSAQYDADQLSGNFNLQHEWGWVPRNLVKYGISYRHQELNEAVLFTDPADTRSYGGAYLGHLRVPGVFIENTFESKNGKFALITGIRADRHQDWGWYTTPRAMAMLNLSQQHTLRASIGTGWRQVNLFSEQINLLASSRDVIFEERLRPETALTWGVSHTWNFWLGTTYATLSGDFYRTSFGNQFFPDYDADPTKAFVRNFEGRSNSNGFQLEGSFQLATQWEFRTAYNYLDVYRLETEGKYTLPFNPRNRVMAAATFHSGDKKWQLDANGQWYDSMRLPDTRSNPVAYQRPLQSKPYGLLNLQATYKLAQVDIYLGCENVANFRQANPIISADNPFGQYFDLSSVWGPIRGREFYAGVRYQINRM